MAYRIEILKKSKQWYWRLVHKGRIIAHSETYSRKKDCLETAENLAGEMWGVYVEEVKWSGGKKKKRST